MPYILDTDVVSNLMQRRPRADVLARLASVPPDEQFITSITVGELVYGAERSSRRDDFMSTLDTRVLENFVVLPFDTPAARTYGSVKAALESLGRRLDEPDLRIASIALARRCIVATGNVRHFGRVPGLTIENWLAP